MQEVKYVRVGAEATVTHRDAPFVTERRGHQTVVQAVDDKARKCQAGARRVRLDAAQHRDPGNLAQSIDEPEAERDFVVEHLVETKLQKRLDRDSQRDRADDVRRSRFLPVR